MHESQTPAPGTNPPFHDLPFLEHYPKKGGNPQRILLDRLPFRIGRSKTANWTVYSTQVSKDHAEIDQVEGDFRVRDLGSTNGTFVNGKRVAESLLANGDILHLAHEEFRFGVESPGKRDGGTVLLTDVVTGHLPASIARGNQYLRELLARNSVQTMFQPIVNLADAEVLGYEALGRGAHGGLSPNPGDLFRLAEQCKLEGELSRTFRVVAVEQAVRLPAGCKLFLNLHPSEVGEPGLIEHLVEVRAALGESRAVVLEIHENAVTDPRSMRHLRDRLREAGVGLAYDDFGAGQSRLMELAEIPPDFVKLDMGLIRGIDQAEGRREVVQAICSLTRDRGVAVIAEGIEKPAEAWACRDLGCNFGQGFLFGRPQLVEDLAGPESRAS